MFQEQTLHEGTEDGSHRVRFLLYYQLHRGDRLPWNSLFVLRSGNVGGNSDVDGNIVHSLEHSHLGARGDGSSTGMVQNQRSVCGRMGRGGASYIMCDATLITHRHWRPSARHRRKSTLQMTHPLQGHTLHYYLHTLSTLNTKYSCHASSR